MRRVIAAHGPLLANGHGKLRAQVEHREQRHAQVLAALTDQPATATELVQPIYGADTPKEAWPLAALSVQSALQLLVERDQAAQVDDGYIVVNV